MERRLQPELMDQPGLDPIEHSRALEGLRRINLLSRTGAMLWPAITNRIPAGPGKPIRILDLASGGGDVPISLMRRAISDRRAIQIEGRDLSPEAVRIAQARADSLGLPVRFSVLDALRDPIPAGFDVITCTLFLHHLREEDATLLLRKMATATSRLVLVDDLIRSRLGYALAAVGCRLLTSSRIVHFDGPASVGAAYRISEACELAERAGLSDATLTRHWPSRFLLSWNRP
jgi:SAM-dependent methyltransferase